MASARSKSRTVGVVLLEHSRTRSSPKSFRAPKDVPRQGLCAHGVLPDESVDRERRYLRVLEEHRVDGLLISSRGARPAATWPTGGARPCPTVLLDRDSGIRELCSAAVDDVQGGSSRPGRPVRARPRQHPRVRERAAPRSAMRRPTRGRRKGASTGLGAGCRPAPRDHCQRPQRRPGREAVGGSFVIGAQRPSAVMCANDLIALGIF